MDEGKEYTTTIYEDLRCIAERLFIIFLFFRIYIFDFIRIIKNIRKDKKKYNLSCFSILYNSLVKYPFLGFQPSAYFMFKLYENSFHEYLTFFEETNGVSKKNKHCPYLLDNKLKFKLHLPDSIPTPKLIAYANGYHKKIFRVSNPSSKNIILKPITGKGGLGIHIIPSEHIAEAIQQFNRRYIIEECIEQHSELNTIFSGSVNTVRVLTLKKDKEPVILSVILRVGTTTTHHVDNIALGGICVKLEPTFGILGTGCTFYSYGHHEYTAHPDTHYKFEGKKIPFFDEIKNLAIHAHTCFPMFLIIGWDIAVTETGPILIEGNRIPDLSLHQIFQPLQKELAAALE
jgi:hypothetical protein